MSSMAPPCPTVRGRQVSVAVRARGAAPEAPSSPHAAWLAQVHYPCQEQVHSWASALTSLFRQLPSQASRRQ